MKSRFIVLWMLFCYGLIVSCCSCERKDTIELSPKPNPMLVEIDSLMWRQPDSALTRLIPYFDTEAGTTFNGHYAHLLLSELLYKNDCEQTNRGALLHAVDYFDSICGRDALNASPANTFLDARAHYIKGVGYYERDSVVEACQEYLKAVEIMENRFPTIETMCTSSPHVPRFMALTYNRLGELFSGQYMMEPSIYCYENSLSFCLIEPTSPQGVSNTLCRLGQQYDMKGEVELASSYYEKALDRLPDTNNIIYRDICVIKALCDYQLDKKPNESINTLKIICEQATSESERLKRLLIIGDIFYEEGEYDSALLYFEPIYEHSEEVAYRMQAADYLRVIYDTIGNREKTDKCVRFLAEYKKSDGENMSLVSKLEDIFQSFINQKKEMQIQKKHERIMYKTIVMIVLVSLGLVLTIIVIVKQNSIKLFKKHQVESDRLIEEKETKYNAELAQQRENLKEVETLLKEKDKLLKKEREAHQRSKKKLLQSLQHCSEAELRREAFLNEPICRKINDNIRNQDITARNCSKKTVAFTEEDVSALRSAVLEYYGNIESHLLSKNPRMSKRDLLLCQLYLLGLDERQIAVLLCASYSTIKKRADKLKEMLALDESLSTYISGF